MIPMTNRIPSHLLRLIRTQACLFVDGERASNEALHIIDRAILHPLNGTACMLNDAHAEFDAAVSRLLEA